MKTDRTTAESVIGTNDRTDLKEMDKEREQTEEELQQKKSGWSIWKMIDNVQGDKVVWIIVLLLMMLSILVVFGSSSRLAIQDHTNRLEIIKGQALTVGMGLGLVFICYKWKWMKVVRFFSQIGFGISLFLLVILFFRLDLGFIRAGEINGAWRVIVIAGKQIHVYEIVKVAMVMYLAWAIETYKKDGFGFIKWLQKRNLYIRKKDGSNVQAFSWVSKPFVQQLFYLYIPILLTALLTANGSNSSMLIFVAVSMLILILGGINTKATTAVGLVIIATGALAIVIVKKTGFSDSGRINTLISRTIGSAEYTEYYAAIDAYRQEPKGSPRRDALKAEVDRLAVKVQQKTAAQIAIKEGGLLGKGPGGSTQQYVVPVMFGDYMYAFILEEYGAWGGLIVLVLYLSLLARGALIAKNLDGMFEQVATGGLVLLISGQAFFHMMINVNIFPLSGQTLPLLSHGTSAFLMVSLAFGLILYFSRLAKENMTRLEAEIAAEKETENSLNDLDQLNNDLTEM